MKDLLFRIAHRLYPPIDSLPEADRPAAAGYVIRSLVFTPPSLGGLVWLAAITDLAELREHWLFLLVLFGFMMILSRLWMEMFYVTESGGYRSDRRSFWGEALWSGVLVAGPSASWLAVPLAWLSFVFQGLGGGPLNRLRIFSQSVFRMSVLLPTLVEVAVYERLGGVFPLPGLTFPQVLPAMVGTLVGFSLGSAMIGISTAINRLMSPLAAASRSDRLAYPVFFAIVTLIGPVAGLVAIFPAGLYSLAGSGAFFVFVGLMTFGVFVVDQLSKNVESARRREREMDFLQRLSQDILQLPPDGAGLGVLLSAGVYGMFPLCRAAIRLYPERALVSQPGDWPGPPPEMWKWERDLADCRIYAPRDPRPWPEDGNAGTLIVPIIEARGHRVVGRIYLQRTERARAIREMLPAAQALAGQIAAALYSIEAYRETLAERLAHERVTQELDFARQVQASFLPEGAPQVEGWDLCAALEPARETSGDFYDLIPMWDGRLGVIIADVADKGMGAALYMALARTLLRVYAVEFSSRYPENYAFHPERVLNSTNQRISEDTVSDMFVTVFYGIFDPQTGSFTYANGGHNPPYLFKVMENVVHRLTRTGLPVGVLAGMEWDRGSVKIDSGDVLVLFTDGLTEAMDGRRDLFGEARLEKAIRSGLKRSAHSLSEHILEAVEGFVGPASRSDDITLVVMKRQ